MLGETLVTELKRQNIRPAVFREVIGKLDQIAPSGVSLPDPSGGPTSSAGGGTLRSAGGHRTTSSSIPEDSTATSRVSQADGSVKGDVVGGGSGTASGKRPSTASATVGGAPGSGKRYEGGFPGGGGSVASSGTDVAPTVPIPLPTERELAAEMEAVSSVLSSLVPEWTERVAAMARLEGIAAGNPGMLDALNELLKTCGMRGSLTKQVGSSMSRSDFHLWGNGAIQAVSSIQGTIALTDLH